jgi:hypothetical protein
MNTDLTFNDDVKHNINSTEIIKEYKNIFRDRGNQDIALNTEYDKIKFVASKLYSKLNIPMSNKSKKVNGVKKVSYNLNVDDISIHKNLIEYSSRHYQRKDIRFIETINTEFHENLFNVTMSINFNNDEKQKLLNKPKLKWIIEMLDNRNIVDIPYDTTNYYISNCKLIKSNLTEVHIEMLKQ